MIVDLYKTNTMDSIENRPLTDVAAQQATEVAAVTEVIATPVQSKELSLIHI